MKLNLHPQQTIIAYVSIIFGFDYRLYKLLLELISSNVSIDESLEFVLH